MIYPGSKRSSLFSKILGKVEKKLYQKPLRRCIDNLMLLSDARKHKTENKKFKQKNLKSLNSELNLIQIHTNV